jgi:hypothetical protein
MRSVHVVTVTAALAFAQVAHAGTVPSPDSLADAVLDSAIARQGGAAALRGITTIRLDFIAQWQQLAWDGKTQPEVLSYEHDEALRNYALPGWRNTRRYSLGGERKSMVDVVRDTVAARRIGNGPWGALWSAYLDERREHFMVAPERVLLLARDAANFRLGSDTVVAGGARLTRLDGRIDDVPTTLFIGPDGFLAGVRIVAPQANDFILATWGTMTAETWYSSWTLLPGGIAYPMQWDVLRNAKPYRRVTMLQVSPGAPAPADSFAVSDSVRAVYLRRARRPMYHQSLDSARVVHNRFASFGAAGAPAGAVRLGNAWLLMESGVNDWSATHALEWLRASVPGTHVAGTLVSLPVETAAGGARALAHAAVPLHVASSAASFLSALGVHGPSRIETMPRWLHIDGDSAWVEPIDLPDAARTLLVYVPSARWVYAAAASRPLQEREVLRLARERGWQVEWVGSTAAVARPRADVTHELGAMTSATGSG